LCLWKSLSCRCRTDAQTKPKEADDGSVAEHKAAEHEAAEKAAAEKAATKKEAAEKAVEETAAAEKAVVDKVTTEQAVAKRAAAAELADMQAKLAEMGGYLEDGVEYTHVRLQMFGPGGVGKSSTIGAMRGRRFAIDTSVSPPKMFAVDENGKKIESTVGAELQVRGMGIDI
jgi:hypothetical protein